MWADLKMIGSRTGSGFRSLYRDRSQGPAHVVCGYCPSNQGNLILYSS